MNEQKKISDWLNSGEYLSELNELRTSIMRDCSISNSESTTATTFENELYYLVRTKTGIKLDFIKEKSLNGINHKFGTLKNRTSGSGRLDAVVNNLIIEYKHHSKLKSKDEFLTASEQVKDYLNALYKKDSIKYNAILTDGIRISYFSFNDAEILNTSLVPISVDDIDTIIKAILANGTKKFVPENIIKDFSINEKSESISRTVAKSLFDTLNNNCTDKTYMLFSEWQSLMHLSVDDNGKSNDIKKRRKALSLIFETNINSAELEYKALYALQTAYAIIVKLIACKIIDKLEYNDLTKNYFDLSTITSDEMQVFFEKMEDGYSYRSCNINNFLEGDFFSWYSDEEQWNDIFWKSIMGIVKCIDQYSAFSINIYYEPIDIFKDLYMGIIPISIRHSMGEYFTPKWVANSVIESGIDQIKNKDNWKAIDPCCGSGIFLIELIKKIVGKKSIQAMNYKEKEKIKNQILNRVYGIDINPLSVLSARVGYYLALKPFGELKNLDIPVYLGDSAIIGEKTMIDGIECFYYKINNLKKNIEIVLPKRYVLLPEYEIIMSQLQSCVKVESETLLFEIITDKFTEEEKNSKKLMQKVQEMADALVYLHKNKWDGIWIRIATNFMLIARLSDFDLIVGNPPWVKWEHLPATYADRIKELCDVKHIFSGAGQFGGTQLNICALIANVTATNWLNKDGVLAFLMPDSILSQHSYEGFRKFYLDYEKDIRLYLQKIDRWLPPLRPFRTESNVVTQDFNTYYYSYNKVDYKQGIEVRNITRNVKYKDNLINLSNSFAEAEEYLQISSDTAMQLSNETTAFAIKSNEYDFTKIIGETAYTYRTGVEFTPQQLYMLEGIRYDIEKDTCYFKNKEFSSAKYKINDMPNGGWGFKTKYIYPIITGPHIEPFKYDSCNEYCILPYTKENIKSPITIEEFLKNNRDLFMYLTNHKELIDSQSEKSKLMHRGDEFYALSKIGDYTFAPYIVAARDNSRFCASVIKQTKTMWKEIKQTICVKHTIIISQRIDGTFIDEDESYFVCGILNSDVIKKYIETSQKSNGYSLNKSKIYIPLYDSTNELHKKVMITSKKASNNEIDIKIASKEITDYYLKICENK